MGLDGVAGRPLTLAAAGTAAPKAAAPSVEARHSLLGTLLSAGILGGAGAGVGYLIGSKLAGGHGLIGAAAGAAMMLGGGALAYFNSGSVVYDPYYDPYPAPYDPGPGYQNGPPDTSNHGNYPQTSPGDDPGPSRPSGGSPHYPSGGTSHGDDSSRYGNPGFQ